MARHLSIFIRRTLILLEIVSYPSFAANPKLIIRNARIMTMAPNQHEPINGYLSIAPDGTILAVAAGEPPASLHGEKIIDAHGDFMIPGFISAHSHLWQAAYRGLAADKTLPGWIDDLYGTHASKASPEDMYWFALLGSLDHLEHGVTTAYNFTYGGRAKTAELNNQFEEAQFRGAQESGIRFVHSYSPDRMSPSITIDQARTRLKAAMGKIAELYPNARFPPVTIAVGRGRPVGTANQEAGVMIGLEALCGVACYAAEPIVL